MTEVNVKVTDRNGEETVIRCVVRIQVGYYDTLIFTADDEILTFRNTNCEIEFL